MNEKSLPAVEYIGMFQVIVEEMNPDLTTMDSLELSFGLYKWLVSKKKYYNSSEGKELERFTDD